MCNIKKLSSVVLLSLAAGGCSLSDLVSTELPLESANPDFVKSARGAVESYRGTITQFRSATSSNYTSYVMVTGLLGDELTSGRYNNVRGGSLDALSAIDSRDMQANPSFGNPNGWGILWRGLQGVRISAMNTIGALRKYAPAEPEDYVGHLFALWGMSEVMLANSFCSGIPLTTIEFEGSFVYKAGSTTEEVYRDAIIRFDSAIFHAPDSSEVRNLALVGKAWALLSLNEYQAAAEVARLVPDTFVYLNRHAIGTTATGIANFASSPQTLGFGALADREGGNGLPYISSGDPRTASTPVTNSNSTWPATQAYAPDRWSNPSPGSSPIIMASGVEARLIEVEAALKADDPSWITALNALRNDGTFSIGSNSADTVWGPGIGATLFRPPFATSFDGMPPLSPAPTAEERVLQLMNERAAWLYLTGRRHPDMRRLIRQYGMKVDDVFPIGPYPAGPRGSYTKEVVIPPPVNEIGTNTAYKGCINHDA